MGENLKAFLEMAKADPELSEKLTGMGMEELIAVAKEKGLELTEADFQPCTGEVGDEELGNVAAGGGWTFCIAAGGGAGRNYESNEKWSCNCVAFGLGSGTSKEPNCFCFAAGWGSNN